MPLFSGSGNISNDYFDRKAERINQQWGPCPRQDQALISSSISPTAIGRFYLE
jgi:hypothetical protein